MQGGTTFTTDRAQRQRDLARRRQRRVAAQQQQGERVVAVGTRLGVRGQAQQLTGLLPSSA
jgi:hypothetical protein